MNGTRLPDETKWSTTLPRGSYWKMDGQWYAITPNGHLANISKHKLVDHGDGTITVSPSIRVSNSKQELWHGFLERGIWRAC